jgi:copper chaperone
MAIVKIKGMSCQHCVGAVTKALSALPGISNVQVDLAKGEASYEGSVDMEAVKTAISKIGFEVVL